MWSDFKEVFVRSGRFALACPVLFAIPILIELVQHHFEIAAGFYASIDGMKAAEHDTLRMVFGHAKVLVLFAAAFWTARFLVFGDDSRAARHASARALVCFAPVLAWGVMWLVVGQDGPTIARWIGASPQTFVMTATVIAFAAGILLEPALSAWKTAAAAGNGAIGFLTSIRLTRGSYFWAVAFSLLVTLPLMIVHYALALASIGHGAVTTWLILGVDAALVGWMAVAMPAASYVIARRCTSRHDVDLAPAEARSRPQIA